MLYLIKGRAGSGKTAWVREKIKEILEVGESKPLLLVPDQFSFENERIDFHEVDLSDKTKELKSQNKETMVKEYQTQARFPKYVMSLSC